MARDRHNLVRRGTTFSERRRGSLANAVRRTMRQISLPAPILEFVSESVGCEWLPEFGEQEMHIAVDVRRYDTLGELAPFFQSRLRWGTIFRKRCLSERQILSWKV